MRMYAALVASAVLAGPALAVTDAPPANGPTGTWFTAEGDSKIKIEPCGQTFCATIVWVKPPEPGAAPGPDYVGTQLSRDLKRNPTGELAGTMLNPENGKTYNVTAKMKNANALEIGGCVLAILCGSETWARAPEEVAAAAPPAKGNTASVKGNSASAKPMAAKAGNPAAPTVGATAAQ
jgi:uncharacterized protein (DUF2147 family)